MAAESDALTPLLIKVLPSYSTLDCWKPAFQMQKQYDSGSGSFPMWILVLLPSVTHSVPPSFDDPGSGAQDSEPTEATEPQGLCIVASWWLWGLSFSQALGEQGSTCSGWDCSLRPSLDN